MPDTRDITQRIAGWLRADSLPDEEQAALTAEAYARLSQRAAARLDRCAALLADGLRTEAVHEANAQPPLLDEMAALELPDLSDWADSCRRRSWAVPEAMRPDVAGMLNQAYAEEAQLEPLLQEHRLRCLVRAPIGARLVSLRALAAADPSNRRWQEGLAELERARWTEIRDELAAARGDAAKLESLHRELHDHPHAVAPPADLTRALDEALHHGRVARAEQQIQRLLPALEEGYSAMDEPACQRLLQEWSQTLATVGRTALEVPPPLRQRVEPISQWIERQAQARQTEDAFRGACDRLRQELAQNLSQGGSIPALSAALAEAVAFERPLPGTLGVEAQEALDRLQRARRRRRNAKASLVLMAAVLVLSGVGLWIRGQQIQREVDGRLADVQAAVDAGELLQARTGWEAFVAAHPDRVDNRSAVEVLGRMNEAQATRARNTERFEQLLVELDPAGVAGWDTAALEEAASLARDEAQRGLVADRRAALAAHRAELARLANVQALEAVPEIRDTLAAIDGEALDQDPQGAQRVATEARGRAAEWLADERIEEPAVALLHALSQRADRLNLAAEEILRQRRRLAAQAGALDALVVMTGRPAALAGGLRAFAERFPEARFSGSFASAAELLPLWEAVRAWGDISATWTSPHPTTRVNAAERLRQIAAYREAHPDSPFLAEIDAYAAHWGAGLLASADDGPWKQRLPELMRAPAFRELGVADTTDGRRFYVVGDADRRETSLGTSVRVALTPDLSRLTPMDFPSGVLGPVRLSPQAGLANRLVSLLADFDFETWELFVLDVVETIQRADDVDAVLRGVLLGLVLDRYQAAVGPLAPELEALRAQLALQADNAANWMNPDDRAAQRSREALKEVFAKPIDFAALRRAKSQRRERLGRGISQRILSHALLLTNDQGEPALRLGSVPPPGPRDVFGVSNRDGPAWLWLGRWETSGRVAWTADVARVPVGSQVWLLEPAAGLNPPRGAGR